MKTQIKSLIIICTLGFVGVLNANATLSYKTSCIAGTLQEQNNAKSENLNSTGFVFNEDADAAINYQMEAQLASRLIADNEEAKTIQMLIDRGIFVSNDKTASFVSEANFENLNSSEFDFNTGTEIDNQLDAKLITKLIADNEEAKTIQKLIDEGFLASNDEIASFVGEVTLKNLNSAEFIYNTDTEVDYQIEAQLITKSIADNEEAKTMQMLIDRGLFLSNDEIVAFAGEANFENLNSVESDFNTDAEIDYQLEAQLITKSIADNEEAKTIQKLIDEGKLAENK